ncbi:MAG: chemotaxis protein CheW [Gemmatimonadetes bacterium]|nr:chemotaxis protein CheW [Gemmatimonadota bacterium]
MPPIPPPDPTPPSAGPPPTDELLEDERQLRFVEVEVDGARWAIPVAQVREVLRLPPLVTVPGAPASVRGVAAVRGGVVTVLDLAVLLGRGRAETPGSIVLVSYGERPVGLAVEAVPTVRTVDLSAPESGALPTVLDAVALCAAHLLASEES